MENTKEFFAKTAETHQDQLYSFMTVIISQGSKSLAWGIFCLFIGLVPMVVWAIIMSGENAPHACFYFCRATFFTAKNCGLFGSVIVSILIESAAVILIKSYVASNKQVDYYRLESIVLRDLSIAMSTCENTDKNDIATTDNEIETSSIGNDSKKTTNVKEKSRLSQRSKIQEQIIETLLDRCSK